MNLYGDVMNIFFLCIGNFCCFILVEVMFNVFLLEVYYVFSVGSQFKGEVYFCVFVFFRKEGIFMDGYYSKLWNNFFVILDVVIMVCGNVVGEICFVYLVLVVRVYWGVEDFDKIIGSDEEIDVVFEQVWYIFCCWIEVFLLFVLLVLLGFEECFQVELNWIGEIIF